MCSGTRLSVRRRGDEVPLVEPACPGRAFGFSIRNGSNALDVTADGPWEALVDQQVETPLAERPLRGMVARNRLGGGRFRGIDQEGAGTASLYRLPGGRLALRFEGFSVTANTDLYVWVSGAAAPRTSADAFHAPHVQVAALKATAGTQNYVLPAGVGEEQARSVVVWCEPVRTAYAAAPLVPSPDA